MEIKKAFIVNKDRKVIRELVELAFKNDWTFYLFDSPRDFTNFSQKELEMIIDHQAVYKSRRLIFIKHQQKVKEIQFSRIAKDPSSTIPNVDEEEIRIFITGGP